MVLWASPGECGQSQAILQTANEVIGWPLSRFFFKGCCGRVPESAASPKQVFKPNEVTGGSLPRFFPRDIVGVCLRVRPVPRKSANG